MMPYRVLYLDHVARLSGGELALLNLLRHLNPAKVCPLVVLAEDGPLVDKLKEIGTDVRVMPLSSDFINRRKESLGLATIGNARLISEVARYSIKLARLAKDWDAHLIHTNSLKADIYGALAGKLSRRPVLWHVRDHIASYYLPHRVDSAFRLLSRWMPDFVVANSISTMTTLNPTKEKAHEVIFSGTVIRERYVIHDGTEVRGLLPISRHATGQSVIGLIGRISPWKGQIEFVRAAYKIHQLYPHVMFLIVGSALFGESEYEDKLRSLVAELGLKDTVQMAGFLDGDDCEAAMQLMDIVVHASTQPEPFGQVIIEAMSMGKPVIATNAGAPPEIVVCRSRRETDEPPTGILVPPGDVEALAEAMQWMLEHRDEAEAMGVAGRLRCMRLFSIEQTARKVERVYDDMLESACRHRRHRR